MSLDKSPAIRSNKMRKWAQGNEAGCQIRLPGCQWTPTIGSHMPSGTRFGKGVSRKPDDLLALSCDYCHACVDRRIDAGFTSEFLRLAWLDGFAATLQLAVRDGLVVVRESASRRVTSV